MQKKTVISSEHIHLLQMLELRPILPDMQAPKAVDNFTKLCTGEKGVGKGSGKPLHYKVAICIAALQCHHSKTRSLSWGVHSK